MSDLNIKMIPALEGTYMANRAKNGAPISEFCVHHMASTSTPQQCMDYWAIKYKSGGGPTSSNYGIKDDEIACFVSDGDIAYCNGNWASNRRSISVEVSNSAGGPNWPVSDKSFESLVKLASAKSLQYGMHPLVVGKNLTHHQMYASTSCPGPYLLGKMQELADRANALNDEATPAPDDKPSAMGLYRVQVGAFASKTNADNYAAKMKKLGYQAIIKRGADGLYRVQVGAFSVKANAESYMKKLKASGYQAIMAEG